MTLQQLAEDTCIVRDTAARKDAPPPAAPGQPPLQRFLITAGSFSTPAVVRSALPPTTWRPA